MSGGRTVQDLVIQWYQWLGGLNAALSGPIEALSQRFDLPLLTAALLGLLGATSPCQLSTSAAALAYVAREEPHPRRALVLTAAYALGKAVVYTAVGLVVIVAGQQAVGSVGPAVAAVRKVLGPLMLLYGLHLLGLLPLRFTVGMRLSQWLERGGERGGLLGSFALGLAFSLAACPTLYWLFFGILMPLALQSPVGAAFPPVFALGTTLPLMALALAVAIAGGRDRAAGRQVRVAGVQTLARLHRPAARIAGVVFLLAGLNDTVIYWLI